MTDIKDTRMNMAEGRLTFAWVDCQEDDWRWAIVLDYEDSQTYDMILCSFAERPSLDYAISMMRGLLHEHPQFR